MLKPFIYIAALRRSGSNLLCEALTLPPHSYVLREPGFARGRFAIKPNDAVHFGECGIDLPGFHERLNSKINALKSTKEQGRAGADLFIDELLPRLRSAAGQIGIKEITHIGWMRYAERAADLGGLRIIVLARDPRDIYLSLIQKSRERRVNWNGPITPESVADNLKTEIEQQRQMLTKRYSQVECLRIRYEDFCADPAVYQRIKEFVGSAIPETGMIGGLNPHNARVHGGAITTTSVQRWQHEIDASLRADAGTVRALMGEYAEAWGYE